MTFQEFTLVDPESQCEVMADVDIESGRIIDLYCYKDNVPVIENYETGKIYKIKTKAGKNPLFVHIASKKRIFKLLLIHGFICVTNEEDEGYNNDIEIFEKALSANGISDSLHCY